MKNTENKKLSALDISLILSLLLLIIAISYTVYVKQNNSKEYQYTAPALPSAMPPSIMGGK